MDAIKTLQKILLCSGDPKAGLIIGTQHVNMICNNEVYVTLDDVEKALKKIMDNYDVCK